MSVKSAVTGKAVCTRGENGRAVIVANNSRPTLHVVVSRGCEVWRDLALGGTVYLRDVAR